ncbi:MAG TPA: hypothetical protein VII11_00360 [Bacteroidota bacterium]
MKIKWVLIILGAIIVWFGFLAVVIFIIPTNKIDGEIRSSVQEPIWIFVLPFSDDAFTMLVGHKAARLLYEDQLFNIEIRKQKSINPEIEQKWEEAKMRYSNFMFELKLNGLYEKILVKRDGAFSFTKPFGHYLIIADQNRKMLHFDEFQLSVFQTRRFDRVIDEQ